MYYPFRVHSLAALNHDHNWQTLLTQPFSLPQHTKICLFDTASTIGNWTHVTLKTSWLGARRAEVPTYSNTYIQTHVKSCANQHHQGLSTKSCRNQTTFTFAKGYITRPQLHRYNNKQIKQRKVAACGRHEHLGIGSREKKSRNRQSDAQLESPSGTS